MSRRILLTLVSLLGVISCRSRLAAQDSAKEGVLADVATVWPTAGTAGAARGVVEDHPPTTAGVLDRGAADVTRAAEGGSTLQPENATVMLKAARAWRYLTGWR